MKGYDEYADPWWIIQGDYNTAKSLELYRNCTAGIPQAPKPTGRICIICGKTFEGYGKQNACEGVCQKIREQYMRRQSDLRGAERQKKKRAEARLLKGY